MPCPRHPNRPLSPSAATRRAALAACLGAAVLAGAAADVSATAARVAALGDAADLLADQGEVLRWCASLAEYPDFAVIESGRWEASTGYDDAWGTRVSGPGAGVAAALGSDGRWGTAALFVHAREADGDPGGLQPAHLSLPVTGLYARRLGPVQAGLRVRILSERLSAPLSGEPGSPTATWRRDRHDVGVGARLDLGARAFLDAAADLRAMADGLRDGSVLPSRPDHPGGAGWRSFGVRTRAFVQTGGRTALVPLLEYVREDNAAIGVWPGSQVLLSTDRRAWLWRGGAALNVFPDLDTMLLGAVQYLHSDASLRTWMDAGPLDRDLGLQVWSLRLAAERRLNPWLILRAAAGVEWRTETQDAWSSTRSRAPLALGAGLDAGRCVLDVAACNFAPGGWIARMDGPEYATGGTWLVGSLRCDFGP